MSDNIYHGHDWPKTYYQPEPFARDEIVVGNPDRTKAISLLDDTYKPGPELDPQMVNPPTKAPDSDAASAPARSS